MKVLKNTLSLCPECLELINAKVIRKEGTIYLSKRCGEHGVFNTKHIWSSESIYKSMLKLSCEESSAANGLVLNLTNDCNLNCPFCYSRANDVRQPELETDLIKQILLNFKGKIIYLSGGEPTIYKDIIPVISLIKENKRIIGLFTNGKRLIDELFVRKLKEAGVDFVILQFDSLSNEGYKVIRGEELIDVKIKAINNLKKYNIPIYLFVMLVREINTGEISRLIRFAVRNKDTIKIINFNPVWDIGRVGKYQEFDSSDIIRAIGKETGISDDNFIESTEFSYYLSKIIGRLRRKIINVQPRCELRCYIFADEDEIIPITDIIDITKTNIILKEVFSKGNLGIGLLFNLLYFSPEILLILGKALFKNRSFRRFLQALFINLLRNFWFLPKCLQVSPLISIIVGNFPTAYNIDFDFVKTCNLYSDFPYENRILSACLRQIILNKNLDNKRSLNLTTPVNNSQN